MVLLRISVPQECILSPSLYPLTLMTVQPSTALTQIQDCSWQRNILPMVPTWNRWFQVGKEVEIVERFKFLSINITNNVSWSNHSQDSTPMPLLSQKAKEIQHPYRFLQIQWRKPPTRIHHILVWQTALFCRKLQRSFQPIPDPSSDPISFIFLFPASWNILPQVLKYFNFTMLIINYIRDNLQWPFDRSACLWGCGRK